MQLVYQVDIAFVHGGGCIQPSPTSYQKQGKRSTDFSLKTHHQRNTLKDSWFGGVFLSSLLLLCHWMKMDKRICGWKIFWKTWHVCCSITKLGRRYPWKTWKGVTGYFCTVYHHHFGYFLKKKKRSVTLVRCDSFLLGDLGGKLMNPNWFQNQKASQATIWDDTKTSPKNIPIKKAPAIARAWTYGSSWMSMLHGKNCHGDLIWRTVNHFSDWGSKFPRKIEGEKICHPEKIMV